MTEQRKKPDIKKILIPIGAVVALIAVILTIILVSGNRESYRLIKIKSFEGGIELQREEKGSVEVFEGLQLISEDNISVGNSAFLELLADSDKHIAAEENTGFRLHSAGDEKSGNITIELLYGKTLITIENKLNEASSFILRSPNAVLSVRGTTFSAEYFPEEEKTVAEVIEGVVSVTYEGGETVLQKGDKVAVIGSGDDLHIERNDGPLTEPENTAPSDSGAVAVPPDANIGERVEATPPETTNRIEDYLYFSRAYTLTGDDSYQSQPPKGYSVQLTNVSNKGVAGYSDSVIFYSSDNEDFNGWMSCVSDELKGYAEAHITEINEYFEENKNEAVALSKADDFESEEKLKKPVDWFPDTVTVTNEHGTYLFHAKRAYMSVSVGGMGIIDGVEPELAYISDYYRATAPHGDEFMYYANGVTFEFKGSLEKIQ